MNFSNSNDRAGWPVILVVEDDALIALTLEDIISSDGYAVQLAHSGYEALECLEHGTCAGLVTDIRLGPGPSGWDVARAARQRSPALPVVYISGDSAHKIKERGVPGSCMLQKPFSLNEISRALMRLVGAHPGLGPRGRL